jgi:hypothetical protein
MASTTCEVQWLCYLLNDLCASRLTPALLLCDNHSARYIAQNNVFHEHTKHIEIDCHVIHEKIVAGLIKLLPIESEHQIANILTKPLEPLPFNDLLPKLGIIDIHSPACWGYYKILSYILFFCYWACISAFCYWSFCCSRPTCAL